MDDDYWEINQVLVWVYNGIMWIEEYEFRKFFFLDLIIKEMYVNDVILMYNYQMVLQVVKKFYLLLGIMIVIIDCLVCKGYV